MCAWHAEGMASPDTTLTTTQGSRRARLLFRRHGGLILLGGLFVTFATITRVALLIKSAAVISWDLSLLAAFGWGLLFDTGAAALVMLPVIVLLTVLPAKFFERRGIRWLSQAIGFVIMIVLLFGGVAEWTFWDEFGVRFNFIAVDYLVYTTEVVGNIRESYNLPLIVGGLVVAAGVGHWMLWRAGWFSTWSNAAPETATRRWLTGAGWLAAALLIGAGLSEAQLPSFRNNYNRELAKNGLWSLFAAFRNNELDYYQFYRTIPDQQAFAHLRTKLTEDGSRLLHPTDFDTLRQVANPGPEMHLNVIQLTIESLSADFLGSLNPASTLTPNLDEIAEHSLIFENFYATGTRTDRGMEALTLSLPPTPGRSIVKRPRNQDLFTLGSVLRTRGYDTAFIYGGYGYFDNMNTFFGGNGYRVVDRNSVTKEDITFANAWGACDEDLYRWTLREADQAHSSGKPFHFFAMTTSNHRPFTYPEGRIDLPPKVSGRAGAVRYTDHAIGEFLRAATDKPWFKHTVFVIVADHCAESAGRTELPVQNYHIPLIIYAPGGQIAPGRIKTLTSQIDYAPTLLGLLNWSYPSRFFGYDVRRISSKDGHALVGTYQKLGHMENREFAVLSPQQGLAGYRFNPATSTLSRMPTSDHAEQEVISYYQTASYLFSNGLYRSFASDGSPQHSRLAPPSAAASPNLIATQLIPSAP